MYRIEISKTALKKLKTFPRRDIVRIASKIESLAKNPYPKNVKKIKGDSNLYRVRSGDYRILYRIYDKVLQIIITDIGHRKNVYKH